MDCQVPSASWPPSTGTVAYGATNAGSTCERPCPRDPAACRHQPLAVHYSAWRGEYRVLYLVHEEQVIVTIASVTHRAGRLPDSLAFPGKGLPYIAEECARDGDTWHDRRQAAAGAAGARVLPAAA